MAGGSVSCAQVSVKGQSRWFSVLQGNEIPTNLCKNQFFYPLFILFTEGEIKNIIPFMILFIQ